jgi:uncharacterized protein (DUF305 family)
MLRLGVIVGIVLGRLGALIGTRRSGENAQTELTPALSAYVPRHICIRPSNWHSFHNQNGSNGIGERRSMLPFSVRAPISVTKMSGDATKRELYRFRRKGKFRSARGSAVLCGILLSSAGLFPSAMRAQQPDTAKPVVVQPGAPGKPSKTLPSSTKAVLPPRSQADVEFMQGMIMHHSQAVEMTALIASHTENKDLRLLGARISSSQSDEIKFMQRWLAARGEPLSMPTRAMSGMDMSNEQMVLMPGMLTPEQMEALRKAKGAEFDRLFLTGMIQHHNGALTMVKDLFDTAGAGQDADLFNFATDADNTQRAEIRIMQTMLENETLEEKR